MRRLTTFFLCLTVGTLLFSLSCSTAPKTVTVDQAKLEMFSPLTETATAPAPGSEDRVALGRMLYYEKRLSANQQISCNSCHQLDKYGVDGNPTSTGHKGQKGDRNSPTVYNAAAHMAQFWDGRAANVEEQAKGPVLNPVEMAMPNDKRVVAVLKSMPAYVQAFKRAYPGEKDPVNFDNAARAIGAFERKLMTPSRWDDFIKGNQAALTDAEKAGFNKFTETGCQTCHAGALLGGNLYQKLGVVRNWSDTSDPGRYKVTKSEADRLVFKVPSLRNAEKTGPYFHNGKVATLREAVTTMADYQLGKTLKPEEVDSVVTWLNSLTGAIPADYIKEPALPKSTSATPKPQAGD